MRKSEVSSIVFAILLVSFLLPFVQISCGNQELKTVTGIQMVTGFKIERPIIEKNKPRTKTIKGEPLTRLAFLLGVIGLVLSFLKGKFIPKIMALIGFIGAGTMLFLKTKIDQKIAETGAGLLAVDYKIGFWLVLFLFAVIFLVNLFLPEKKK